MNLYRKLRERADAGKPLRIALIGAGKFGSMFLSQARRTPGLHVVAVADLDPARACVSLARVGWPAAQYSATSLDGAARSGATFITDDAPSAIASTPDTVWRHYGFSPQQVAAGDFNAQMFNSFLDGTKSALEMAAVANATGLEPAAGGLAFPPCGVDDLPRVLKPRHAGGELERRGQVEVVSSLNRDGSPVPRDLRWGVYVTFAAGSDYVRRCFAEYGLVTDETGEYAAMYKPFHLIGLELGISVAAAGLRREATGAPDDFRADVVAVAKRALQAGERLDGEGGYTVYGRLMPAAQSLRIGGLPIGLAHGVELRRAVAPGEPLTWSDVTARKTDEAVRVRREMEGMFKASADPPAAALLR